MGSLMLGGAILVAAFLLFTAAAGRRTAGGATASGAMLRSGGWLLAIVGALILVSSTVIVIDAGQVGVRHAFGNVDPNPLMSGVRFVTPWSNIERFSTREEQSPASSGDAEQISALSSEQMGMQVDVAVRWQIDPQQAPHIFRELGSQDQIQNVVRNMLKREVLPENVANAVFVLIILAVQRGSPATVQTLAATTPLMLVVATLVVSAALPLREKTLIWHLYLAAIAGRDIYYDQRYAHNLPMREILEAVLTHPHGIEEATLNEIRRYTKLFWINTGPYNNLTARKFVLNLTPEAFRAAVAQAAANGASLPLANDEDVDSLCRRYGPMFFDALSKTTGYRIEGKNLLLSGPDGLLARLVSHPV